MTMQPYSTIDDKGRQRIEQLLCNIRYAVRNDDNNRQVSDWASEVKSYAERERTYAHIAKARGYIIIANQLMCNALAVIVELEAVIDLYATQVAVQCQREGCDPRTAFMSQSDLDAAMGQVDCDICGQAMAIVSSAPKEVPKKR